MTNEEAKRMYFEGVRLFEAGSFAESLVLLDELDAARPNSKLVLYHRALCLIELKRLDDAEACSRKLEAKLEEDRFRHLKDRLAAARASASPKKTEADDTNVMIIESAFPVSTDQTTVTGHVKSGVFRTGDMVTLVSPEGMPLTAPIVRLGTAETPVNLVRAGHKAVMLLQVEPHHVVPGSSVTSLAQEAAYAATMVVSTDGQGGGAAEDVDAELFEVEKLVKHRQYDEAEAALEAYLRNKGESGTAYRILARIHLEPSSPRCNPKQAVQYSRKAFELGGADNPAVVHTLADALAADGEADQGLRFLERLYTVTTAFEARMALAQRIHDYRAQHGLGHVWEFADSYGEVIFEAADPKEILKALTKDTVPRDAKCRRDHIGEWRDIETALAPDYPDIAALYKPAPSRGNLVFVVLVIILVAAIVATLVASL